MNFEPSSLNVGGVGIPRLRAGEYLESVEGEARKSIAT